MTSRSETIPATSSPSTTGTAPIRRSASRPTASRTEVSAGMLTTSPPFLSRIAAMVIGRPPVLARLGRLSPPPPREREDAAESNLFQCRFGNQRKTRLRLRLSRLYGADSPIEPKRAGLTLTWVVRGRAHRRQVFIRRLNEGIPHDRTDWPLSRERDAREYPH